MIWENYFRYCSSGRLIRIRGVGGQLAGTVVGCKNNRGYLGVFVGGRSHKVHRIVWEMHNGPIPFGMSIDHVNGVKDDNRIENLRLATHLQNMGNQARSRKKSKYKGVYFNRKLKKFSAHVCFNYKQHYLGLYPSAEEAALAYNAKAAELFGEFAAFNEVDCG